MLDMAVLGLLKQEHTMHGYQIKKELTNQLGQLWRVSFGSLYPAITRLEKMGAVEQVFPKGEVKRRKNIYRITQKGEEIFSEALSEEASIADDAGFGLKLAFFRYVNPETRVQLLERRRAYLTDKLANLRDQLREYKQRIDDYTYRLMEHGAQTTSADIEWIDRLIAEEKRAV
jgi:DNA-binding PadR family transcriptional regulator